MEGPVFSNNDRFQKNSERVLLSLRKIIQLVDLHSRYLQKQAGLTGPQLLILYELSSGGDTPLGKLAKAISLSQATVTGIVERLENRNLVSRSRSKVDRRRVFLQLTPAGRSLLKDAPPLMQPKFLEAFNQLENWEQLMILSTLQRLEAMMAKRSLQKDPAPSGCRPSE